MEVILKLRDVEMTGSIILEKIIVINRPRKVLLISIVEFFALFNCF